MTSEDTQPRIEAEHAAILAFAIELAERASEMIIAGSDARWTQPAGVDAKANSVDLVTETDQAVEKMIRDAISARYPAHGFLGEETYAEDKKMVVGEGYTWIVDPIDGTMKRRTGHMLMSGSFVHSNAHVACSIGVAWNGQPVVGVIALPYLKQIFSARVGEKAYLNGTIPLPLTGGIPQPLTELSKCLIAAEWGSDRSAETFGAKARSFVKLAGDPSKGIEGGVMAHALRTTGSSACNIVLVASGQLDMYWDAGMWAWDVCAGAVLLDSTGGFASGGKGAFENDHPMRDILTSRRWVCVRAVPPTATETSDQIQRRLVKELYDVVEPWTTGSMK